MRIVAAIVILAACGDYEPIDYSQYAYRCDDQHGCPSPQQCLGGICQLTSPSRDGVVCGAAGVCGKDQQCCYDGMRAFCVAPTESCRSGSVCDGVEDCPSGTYCCPASSGPNRCMEQSCEDRVCLDSSDCGAANYCCAFPDPSSPLHTCVSFPCPVGGG